MKYQTTKQLTTLDISTMGLKQLQAHKVRLLDAWQKAVHSMDSNKSSVMDFKSNS